MSDEQVAWYVFRNNRGDYKFTFGKTPPPWWIYRADTLALAMRWVERKKSQDVIRNVIVTTVLMLGSVWLITAIWRAAA